MNYIEQTKSFKKIVSDIQIINQMLCTMGVAHPDPLLTISTLTSPAIPFSGSVKSGMYV